MPHQLRAHQYFALSAVLSMLIKIRPLLLRYVALFAIYYFVYYPQKKNTTLSIMLSENPPKRTKPFPFTVSRALDLICQYASSHIYEYIRL